MSSSNTLTIEFTRDFTSTEILNAGSLCRELFGVRVVGVTSRTGTVNCILDRVSEQDRIAVSERIIGDVRTFPHFQRVA